MKNIVFEDYIEKTYMTVIKTPFIAAVGSLLYHDSSAFMPKDILKWCASMDSSGSNLHFRSPENACSNKN